MQIKISHPNTAMVIYCRLRGISLLVLARLIVKWQRRELGLLSA